MKKRFTEEQIIGFLREAECGVAIKDLCRRHRFSEASYYHWCSKFGERPPEEAPGRVDAGERGDARGTAENVVGAAARRELVCWRESSPWPSVIAGTVRK